jgi:hypothetical protein
VMFLTCHSVQGETLRDVNLHLTDAGDMVRCRPGADFGDSLGSITINLLRSREPGKTPFRWAGASIGRPDHAHQLNR